MSDLPLHRITAVAVLVLGTVLAGCSAEQEPAASAPPSSVPASPTPSASPSPEPTGTVLFTVSATARATDDTSLELVLTGYEPIVADLPEAAALVDDFLTLCGESGGVSTSEAGTPVSEETLAEFGSSLMRIDYTVTPDAAPLAAPVEVVVGIDNLPTVASGDGLRSLLTTETCLNRYELITAGSGSFVANYESGARDADPGQWRLGSYGFVVPVDSGTTLEACEVTITPAAQDALVDTPGWEDGAVGTGLSCGTGYQG